MNDEELKQYRQMVYMQVEYLANCYPNLKWDGELTAVVWSNALIENNVSAEELYNTCHNIVNDGYEDWQINISLIINKIIQIRKYQEVLNNQKKFEERMQTPVISQEKLKYYIELARKKGLRI